VADIKNHKFFEEIDFGTRLPPLSPVPSRARPPAAAAAAKPAQIKPGERELGDD
jgi:hypothetical protein